MKLKPSPIEISADDPFKYDVLSRRESCETLTEFVSSLEEPFVLSIDAAWGSGKTTFLKMWAEHLKKQSFSTIYFNAWENDFSDSPLVSLIGEFGTIVRRSSGRTQSTVEKIFEKTKNAGAVLLKAAIPVTLKAATAGVIDLAAMNGEKLSEIAEDIAKKRIEHYDADKETITHFRCELGNLVKSLAEKDDKTSSSKPVVFIIDELDRCRPPYAIQLLEKIKHLFSVPGLVFILATDKHQLCESIKSLYGAGMDADGYLRRFIDLEYSLPKPDIETFVDVQFARFGLTEILANKKGSTREDHGNLKQALLDLFKLYDFSLRTQEQIFTRLAVVVRTTPAEFHLYGFHLANLICLRISNRSLYLRYIEGVAPPSEVISFLRSKPLGSKFIESHVGRIVVAHLIIGIPDYEARNKEKQTWLTTAKAGPEAAATEAREICEHFQWIGRNSQDITGYLAKKIEIAQRFHSK